MLTVNTRILLNLLKTETLIFLREELEDSLKKAKERHFSLQALKPKPPHMLQLRKSSVFLQKTIAQQKDPWLATRAPHSHRTLPQAHGKNCKNNPAGKAITKIRNMGGTEGTAGQ